MSTTAPGQPEPERPIRLIGVDDDGTEHDLGTVTAEEAAAQHIILQRMYRAVEQRPA